MRKFFLLTLALSGIMASSKSGTGSPAPSLKGAFANVSNTSEVVVQSSYTYATNINYKLYTASSGFTTSNSVGVMGITVRDAGDDGLPTTLTSITFSMSAATGNAIKTAAIFTGGIKVASYVQVAAGSTTLSFSTGSGWPVAAADGGTKDYELRVTFKTTVTDYQQLQFTVSSVTELAGGSSFAAPDGGGATSSITDNNNKISVIADRFKFGQQPSDVFTGNKISPSVTVKAVDVNKNVDSDYISAVKLSITNPTPSCDTLAGNLVFAVGGIATFPDLNPNVAEDNITLTAIGSLTSTVSNSFTVNSAHYSTLLSWDFTDNNVYADAGVDPIRVNRSIFTSATGPINFGACNCADNNMAPSAYSTGWDNGSGNKYWQIDFSTLGHWYIKVSFRQRSSPTGPRDFKVQSKIGNGSWQDIATLPALADTFKYNFIRIPAVDSPFQSYNVSVRWVMNSNAKVDATAGSVDNAGASYIDDISLIGISTTNAKELYYRSNGSGPLESSCNWQTSSLSSGPWAQAKGAPDFSAYDITVRSGDIISVNNDITLDRVIVDAGATLVLNHENLHIVDDGLNGAALTINGTLIDNTSGSSGITFGTGGTWQLGSAGTFIKTNNSSATVYRDNYEGGISAIPSTANWTVRYTGNGNPAFTTDKSFYPNLTFESTNGAWDPGTTSGSYFSGSTYFATVKGNLDIGGTGSGTVKISNLNTNSQPLLVKGNTIIRAGNELSNISTGSTYGTGFELKGNLTVDGTLTTNGGGTGTLKMSGSVAQTISNVGALNLQNFTIANTGAGVTLSNDITVGGTDSLLQGILYAGTNTLTLSGLIIRTAGYINGSLNTTILNGAFLQTVPANTFVNNTIKNLTISNDVSLAGQDTLTGALTMSGTNKTFATNDYLTLKSTATATANVAPVPVNPGGIAQSSITGDVTVERYISAKRAWRFLSIPTNTLQTVKQAWQEGATSKLNNPVSGYGLQITDKSVQWGDYGFDDFSPDGPSLKKWNSNGNSYTGISNTSVGIATAEGLMTFVRGDRTAMGLNATPTSTILRTKGPLKIGDQQTTAVPSGKIVSVGNPYASAIDMRTITKTPGKNFTFYLYDANINSLGAFQTFILDADGNYYSVPGPSSAHNYIQSGQAFFVASDGGNITIKEESKAGVSSPSVFRSLQPKPMLRTNLYIINGSGNAELADGVLNNYGENFSNAVDGKDAKKVMNFSENLSIKSQDQLLAIERRHSITKNDTIFLNIAKMKVRSYRFEITGGNFIQNDLAAFLEDSYNNTFTPLDLNGTTTFNFRVVDVVGSWNPDRFKIVFKKEALQPFAITSAKAYRQNMDVKIEWNVINEKNIKEYDVERSANGSQFTKASAINNISNKNSSANYNWLDVDPVTGNNYYRIRSIDVNGEIQYSTVTKVIAGNNTQGITVYPNPVVGGIINLQLADQPKGKYSLKLVNEQGQVVMIKQIEHEGGSAIKTIPINKAVAKGNYQLKITNAGSQKACAKLQVQ